MSGWFSKRPKVFTRHVSLEQLEERIVLDASVAGADSQENQNDNQESVLTQQDSAGAIAQQGAEPPTPGLAASQDDAGDLFNQDLNEVLVTNALDVVLNGSDPNGDHTPDELRLLVISSGVAGADILADAARDGVTVIQYDGNNDTPTTILLSIEEALGGRKAAGIGFATHSLGEGQFHLAGGYTVSPSTIISNSEVQAFWQEVGDSIEDGGRVDLFACNLAGTQAGNLLVSQLESITGRNVAASDDTTGSSSRGGDWLLETDNVDLLQVYLTGHELDGVSVELAAEHKLLPEPGSGSGSGQQYGFSVSVDGDYAIVGARYDDEAEYNAGSAYVLHWDGSTWALQAELTASDADGGDLFGRSVSISDGYAIVGAYANNDHGFYSGSAYVFHWDGSSWTEQAKLTASDATENDYFGYSVSISGEYAIVGAYGNDDAGDGSSSAYVFHWDGSNWVQHAKLTASDAAPTDVFGYSVSISGDDAIVGAYQDDDAGSSSGSAYVFHFDGSAWTQTAKLTASDAAAADCFGYAVSIDDDEAIVGALGDEDNGVRSGSAYVFHFDGSAWGQQGKLTASDGAGLDLFGSSVAISGNRAVVGAYSDDDAGSDSGTAFVFHWDGSNWTEQAKLTLSDSAAYDNFGWSVSICGEYAVVGAYRDGDAGSEAGSATVFHWDGTVWSEQAKTVPPPDAHHDFFGRSVSMEGDYAIVGAYQDDDAGYDSGSAYVFRWDGSSWNQQAKLTASHADSNDSFGYSVSISGDYAIVGAHRDDDGGYDSGAAYVFHWDGSSWTQQAKLAATDADSGDWFGYSVSISGDYAIVGAYQDDAAEWDSGSAYLFHRDGTSWSQQAKLTASDGAANDYFGWSVSVSGDYAIVGAYRDDDVAGDSGSAYVFHWDGSSWNEQAKLTASDAALLDYFGYSVSISGEYAIVGARDDDDAGTDSGSAYIYHFDGGSWTEQAKLYASDGAESDRFGHAVSMEADRAVVGAYLNDQVGTNAGAAYVFDRNGSTWTEWEKLTASDGAAGDVFGWSVSVSGNHTIVGAYCDDDAGMNAGTAYVFELNGDPTNITLSHDTVDENEPADTVVGTFSTIDPNTGDTHTYSLVGGAGSDDNSSFTIDGNTLLTAEEFDYETKATYTIRVQTDDGNGGTYEEAFTIQVNNRNDQPTIENGGLPAATVNVAEDAADTAINLANYFHDVEDVDNLTYTVSGNTNPGLFSAVSIDNLTDTLTLDYLENAHGSAQITITATDNGLGEDPPRSLDQILTVNVIPLNDTPNIVDPGEIPPDPNMDEGASTTFTLTAHDVDEPDATDVNFVIESVAGGAYIVPGDAGDGGLTNISIEDGLLTGTLTPLGYIVDQGNGAYTQEFEFTPDGTGEFDIAYHFNSPKPGVFQDHGIGAGIQENSYVAVGDVDGDGDLDLVYAEYGNNAVVWYENVDGEGSFLAMHVIDSAAVGAYCVQLGDVDGDTDLDVVAALHIEDKVVWYENTDGQGTFGSEQVIDASVNGAIAVQFGDVDGDDDLDVVCAAYYDQTVAWYENTDGNSSFGPEQIVMTDAGGPYYVALGDVNGDGDPDVATSAWNRGTIVWQENTDGNATFGPEQIILDSGGPGAGGIDWGDVDGDGDLDLVAGHDSTFGWFENTDGTGSFGPEQILTNDADEARSAVLGDVDADGDLDIVTASRNSGQIGWFENTDGKGTFGPENVITTGATLARWAAVGDLDGNGWLDVAAANEFGPNAYFNGGPEPSNTATATITVNDVASAFVGGGPIYGFEATPTVPVDLNDYFSAVATDPLTFEYDHDGDGSYDPVADSSNFSITFADNGTFSVAVRATDDEGSAVVGTITADIENVAPVVWSFTDLERDGGGGAEELEHAQALAMSPDQKHVYVVGFDPDNWISVFGRDAATGDLSFVQCLKDSDPGIDGLFGAHSVVVSPDNNHVYVVGQYNEVGVFSRDTDTGELTFVQCLRNGVDVPEGLEYPQGIALSPDGNHVYITSVGDEAISVFSRNAGTGELTFLQCLKNSDPGIEGLNMALNCTVSPDGASVYAVGHSVDNSLVVFSRDPGTGLLTFVECHKDGQNGVDGLNGIYSVAVSPDNEHVYVASKHDDSVAVFDRKSSTGTLTFQAVYQDGLNGIDGLSGAISVTVSDDGERVYVAGAADDAVAMFWRNSDTGLLAYMGHKKDGVDGVNGLDAAIWVEASSDGQNVYVASTIIDDAVAVFSHDMNPTVEGQEGSPSDAIDLTSYFYDVADVLTYEYLDPASGAWTPIAAPDDFKLTFDDHGTYVVQVTADDGDDTATGTITYEIANALTDEPVILPGDIPSVGPIDEGSTTVFTLTGRDADEPPVVIRSTNEDVNFIFTIDGTDYLAHNNGWGFDNWSTPGGENLASVTWSEGTLSIVDAVACDPAAPGEYTQQFSFTGADGDSTVSLDYRFRTPEPGDFVGRYANFDPADGRSIAKGDVDGDGDVDAVIGCWYCLDELRLNEGSTFSDRIPLNSFGWRTSSVALGDLDGDGDLDLVLGMYDSYSRVMFNDGSGGFTESQTFGVSSGTLSIALGDMDGDGDLDVVQGRGGWLDVWENDGNGVFSTTIGHSLHSGDRHSIALGDLDGDGDLDVVEGNYSDWNRVHVNNGSGRISYLGVLPDSNGTNTSSVALGDVDNDGDLDVVEGNVGTAAPRILLNDGSGSFAFTQEVGRHAYSVLFGDFDGDGDLDLQSTNQAGDLATWANDGTGVFALDWQGDMGVMASAFADVDGDGWSDILYCETNFSGGVYFNAVGTADSDAATLSIGVNNVAPVEGPDIPDMITDEGVPATAINLNDFFSDVAADLPLSFTYNDGNGNSGAVADPTTFSLIYGDNGVYTATVTADDGDDTTTAIFTVTVNNVAPVEGPAIPDMTTDEGVATVAINLNDYFSDVAADLPLTFTFDDGNGNSGAVADPTSFSLTYGDQGVYTATVTADDGDDTTTATFRVEVNNVDPVFSGAIANQTINEGGIVSIDFTGMFTDVPADTMTFAYQVDAGAWVDLGSATTFDLTYGDNGTHDLVVRATDDEGGTADSNVFTITVNNVAPFVGPAVPDMTTDEGVPTTAINLNDFFRDVADDLPLTFTYNDGNGNSGAVADPTGFSLPYGDQGVYSATVTADDGDDTTTATFRVEVNNIAPVFSGTIDNQTIHEGETASIDFTGMFTDVPADTMTFAYQVDGNSWVDLGSATTFDLTFGDNGSHDVVVRATDDDGRTTDSNVFTITVNNVAPVEAPAIPDMTTDEGVATTAINLNDYFSDVAADLPLSFTYNDGNGNSGAVADPTTFCLIYGDNGVYTATVTANDGDDTTTATFRVEVNNIAPVFSGTIDNQTIHEGETASIDFTGMFTDVPADTMTFAYQVDGNSWVDLGSATTFDLTYGDNGTHDLVVRATDDEGGTADSNVFTITVNNVAPVEAPAIPDMTTDEGVPTTAINLNDFFSDVADDLPLTFTFDDGNGNSGSVTDPTSFSLTYGDNGVYTATVTADDGDDTTTATFRVEVNNVDPVFSGAIANQIINEGGTVSIDFTGMFTDVPADTMTFAYQVDGNSWVDLGSATTFYLTFGDNGSHDVVVRATDDDGRTTDSNVFTITVNNVAPVEGPAIPDMTTDEGVATTAINLNDYFSDVPADLPLTFTYNDGNGNSGSVTDTTSFCLIYGDNGVYTATVTADDGDDTTTATFRVEVNNVDPVFSGAIANQTIDEGGTVSIDFTGIFTDVPADTMTFAYQVDGGAWVDLGTATTFDLTYGDNGTHDVVVRATDDDGGTTVATFTVTVDNLDPVVVSPIPNMTVFEYWPTQPMDLNCYFSDVPDDLPLAFSYSVYGGPLVTLSAAEATDFSLSFADPVTYEVTVQADDGDGGVTHATFVVNVDDLPGKRRGHYPCPKGKGWGWFASAVGPKPFAGTVGPRPFGPDFSGDSEALPRSHAPVHIKPSGQGEQHRFSTEPQHSSPSIAEEDSPGRTDNSENPLGLTEFLRQLNEHVHDNNVLVFNLDQINLAQFFGSAAVTSDISSSGQAELLDRIMEDTGRFSLEKMLVVDLDEVKVWDVLFDKDYGLADNKAEKMPSFNGLNGKSQVLSLDELCLSDFLARA